jgi:membrane associated rhomboid family serine protease
MISSFKNRVSESLIVPVRFSFLIILVFLFAYTFRIDLSFLGIQPLKISYLHGVLFAPLIHGNFLHLITNLFPLFILTFLLYFFYNKIADLIFIKCYLFTNLIVWLAGRPYVHIGASGLVYGLAFFLMAFGFFRGTLKSLFISGIIIFLYGGIIYGLIPSKGPISWESHLAGAAVGIVTAFQVSAKTKISNF